MRLNPEALLEFGKEVLFQRSLAAIKIMSAWSCQELPLEEGLPKAKANSEANGAQKLRNR